MNVGMFHIPSKIVALEMRGRGVQIRLGHPEGLLVGIQLHPLSTTNRIMCSKPKPSHSMPTLESLNSGDNTVAIHSGGHISNEF